ncbi:MAG TPA: CDP-diacylglycerol--glycerol-3-phosphate 3-phosphatidyltransferase [Acholeplasmataceae bacterium]|nr:CDP-diacylglycerol--glycerol-3-phosphate 3-phosphatidyltransferase [Acholeplasmataceae bacterium]
MTSANKVTLTRMALIPVMIVFMSIDIKTINWFNTTIDLSKLIAAIIFVIAAFTDFLDGYLARKNNEITTFGKFLDPIADKVLVIAAMLFLINRVHLWAVMIVIFREFAVTGLRLLAVDKGNVIAASPYGKIKTAATMLALIIMLFNDFGLTPIIADVIWYIAVFFTALSGFDYIYKNRKIIFESI